MTILPHCINFYYITRKKNPNAVKAAKARWSVYGPEERSEAARLRWERFHKRQWLEYVEAGRGFRVKPYQKSRRFRLDPSVECFYIDNRSGQIILGHLVVDADGRLGIVLTQELEAAA